MKIDALKYSKKHKLPFSESPLNRLDVLIFTWFTYFDMSSIVAQMPLKLSSLKGTFFEKNIKKLHVTWLPSLSAKLFRNTLHNPRFADAEIVLYETKHDNEAATQFGALAMKVDNTLLVLYEGTDLTAVGWKEDCVLSYSDSIGSYPLAEAFLKKAMALYPDCPVILAGHSKGGNIASYVLSAFEDDSRIQKVYSFEGPGFHNKSVFAAHPEREQKIARYIPQGALVGVMLNTNDKDTVIVRSPSFFVFQHNALRWLADPKTFRFIRAKKLSISSKYFDESANQWINELSNEDKERFVSIFFNAIGDRRGNLYDILANIFTIAPTAIRLYQGLSKEDQAFFNSILKKYPQTAWDVAMKRFKRKLKKMKTPEQITQQKADQ